MRRADHAPSLCSGASGARAASCGKDRQIIRQRKPVPGCCMFATRGDKLAGSETHSERGATTAHRFFDENVWFRRQAIAESLQECRKSPGFVQEFASEGIVHRSTAPIAKARFCVNNTRHANVSRPSCTSLRLRLAAVQVLRSVHAVTILLRGPRGRAGGDAGPFFLFGLLVWLGPAAGAVPVLTEFRLCRHARFDTWRWCGRVSACPILR